MKKRYKMKRKNSNRKFSKSANKSHKMNFGPRPMRGGTRL